MRNVTFKQLQAFVILCHERNFRSTSERLCLTPPTVTATIQSLEEAIGLKFFDRSTRSVNLTSHAESFLPIAERLLDDLERALEDLHAVSRMEKGSVVVTGASSLILHVLAPAVAEMARRHPEIKVTLLQDSTENAVKQVLEAKADFCVTAFGESTPEIAAHPLIKDRFGITCHHDHPLAKSRSSVHLHDAASFTTIGLSRGNGLQAVFEHSKRVPASLRKPSQEVSNVALMLPFIEQNLGIAVLPALSARLLRRPPITFIPIRGPLYRHLSLVMRRGRSLSPAARRLCQIMFDKLSCFDEDPLISVVTSAQQLDAFVQGAAR